MREQKEITKIMISNIFFIGTKMTDDKVNIISKMQTWSNSENMLHDGNRSDLINHISISELNVSNSRNT